MIRLLFTIFTIICYSLPFVIFFNYKFGKALPLSYIVLTFFMFICSLFNNISLIKYLVLFGEVIIIFYITFNFKRIKAILFDNVARFSTIIFIILFFYLYFVLKERMYVHIDDYYFWGPLVRDSIKNNALYSTEYAYAHIGSYPPFLTLLEILFCKLLGSPDFVDGISILAVSSFSISLFMILLDENCFNFRHLLKTFVILIIVIASTLIISANNDIGNFFLYNTTLIDWTMGFLFAHCMFLAFSSSGNIFDSLGIGICCSALILVKQVAVPLTILVLTTYLFLLILRKKINRYYFVCIFIPFFIYFVWQMQVLVFSNKIPLNLSINTINKVARVSNMEKTNTIIRRFINAFFLRPISTHPIQLSYFIIIFGTSLIYIFIAFIKNNREYYFVSLFNFLGGLGYSLVILISYITVFNDREGLSLICFGRYMQTYSLASIILLIMIFVREISSTKKLLLIAIAICILVEPKSIVTLKKTNLEDNKYYYFKNMFTNFYNYVYQGEKTTILISYDSVEVIMIYDIAHDNDKQFDVYDSYANNDSCDNFINKIKDSKYLIVIDSNDKFWKTCNHLFEDNVIIHESIYTINYDENGNVHLLRL